MKHIISFCLLTLCTQAAVAQQTFLTKEGHVTFFSKAPLEDIEAKNAKVSAALDLSSKEIVVKMDMVDFHFEKALMEEHFNENYIESDKYPTAIFQGSFSSENDLSVDGDYTIMAEGEITLHGITKPLLAEVAIQTSEGKIEAKSNFKIKTADHEIKIPRIVIKNIAEIIDVTVDLTLTDING
ncbi:MAG: YceI family protein [Saprospiraceae bacterium]|nr:YceI family protein [Saprospiraceae bacterium]